MVSKFKIIVACILILLSFSACAKSNSNPRTSNEEDVVTKTEKNPVTKDDYLNALYGYYEYDDYYYFIAEDTFEKKNKIDGKLENSGMLASIEVYMQDDGVSFDIIFYRDAYPKVTMLCNSKGVITDEYNNIYVEITKKQYDSVTPVEPNYEAEGSDSPDYNYDDDFGTGYSDQTTIELPWSAETFDIITLVNDLQYIDNLFAVGKKGEAEKEIQARIFDKLDTKVDELIKSREYWAAFNYVAMYNVHVMDNDVGISYSFIDEYFEEEYKSSDAITIDMAGQRFSDFTQKYFIKILQAKKSDKNRLSQQDCLYKMNEFLLANGLGTKSGLWDGEYQHMYFTDFLDQNYDVTDYYIICPYTGQIRHLPANLYYMDHGLLYENHLKEYL